MLNFSFHSPTFFEFGRGAETKAGALAKQFGGSKVLLHYGGGSAVRSGLLGRVEDALKQAGIPYVSLGGAQPNPRDTLVYEGIRICREEQVDMVLAVGGGSVIDSAKAIAVGALYEGDFWDFFEGRRAVERTLPVGVVLTIAAAGSEGSNSMVITKEEGALKRGVRSELVRPAFAMLNPELTFTLPAYQTACGAADIMAHIMERYFTNTPEVELTDRLCEAILLTMLYEVPRVMADPAHYDARANIMWAGALAHNDLCGVGREQDWGSHGIEHELSAMYDVAHGAGLAVVFPAWMKYVYKHDVLRFAQFAQRIFGCQMHEDNPEATALEGIQRLTDFWKSIGLPTTFEELGAKEEDIPEMVRKVAYAADGTRGKFVPLTPDMVADVYKLMRTSV